MCQPCVRNAFREQSRLVASDMEHCKGAPPFLQYAERGSKTRGIFVWRDVSYNNSVLGVVCDAGDPDPLAGYVKSACFADDGGLAELPRIVLMQIFLGRLGDAYDACSRAERQWEEHFPPQPMAPAIIFWHHIKIEIVNGDYPWPIWPKHPTGLQLNSATALISCMSRRTVTICIITLRGRLP